MEWAKWKILWIVIFYITLDINIYINTGLQENSVCTSKKKCVPYGNWEVWGTFLFPEVGQEFHLRLGFKPWWHTKQRACWLLTLNRNEEQFKKKRAKKKKLFLVNPLPLSSWNILSSNKNKCCGTQTFPDFKGK